MEKTYDEGTSAMPSTNARIAFALYGKLKNLFFGRGQADAAVMPDILSLKEGE